MFQPDIRDILIQRVNNAVNSFPTPANVSFQIKLNIISSFPSTMYVEKPSGGILRNGATAGSFGTIAGSGREYSYTIPCTTAATGGVVRVGMDLPAGLPQSAGMQLKVFNGIREIDMRTCLVEEIDTPGLAVFPVGYALGGGTIGDLPNPFVSCQ